MTVRAAATAPVALVTGVSSGIGRAIATRLLDQGWQVAGVSRRDPGLDQAAFRWIAADLTRPEDVAAIADDLDQVQAVVHAAGQQYSARLGELNAEHGARMWQLHVQAPITLLNSVVAKLTDGGRIVLIGSRTSTGVAGKSQYVATKSALTGLARSWAIELAPRRITVNVVAPGPTDTAMLTDPGRVATPPRLPPLGRFVPPAEVAALTAFLLGAEGGSITGQQLVICGGASL